MQDLYSIYHLVHIGYDPNIQKDFSSSVKKVIEMISDKTGIILNFVDESGYTREENQNLQVIKLANTISDFLTFCHTSSCFSSYRLFFLNKLLSENPAIVINYLFDYLDGIWQLIEKPVDSFNSFKTKYLELGLDLPVGIKNEVRNHDAVFKIIYSSKFLDILIQLRNIFNGKNPYNLSDDNLIRNDKVGNLDRKLEIVEYAEKLLGKERIVFTGMIDSEIDKIEFGLNTINGIDPFPYPDGISTELWETQFGNATDYIDKVNAEISIDRYNRFNKSFFESLKSLGFRATDDTLNVLGGEYKGCCVNQIGNILQLFGFKEEKIIFDDSISLSK